jgi:hypothetical protein
MEEHIDMVAEEPEAVGVADVEFDNLDTGQGGKGSVALGLVERTHRRPDAISPLGKGTHEIAADMAVRSCDKSLHDQRLDGRLRRRFGH